VIDLHWSEKEGSFCDATIDEFEEHKLVCHKGYVTLLPFMIGLLDDDKDAKKISLILKMLSGPEHLWSDHGIRSLSKQDELYGTDENYWRSPIWVNMNYLVLTRLYAIGRGSSSNAKEAGKLYLGLRKNLVNTVYESWKETGFAWEQYNPETGEGQRTQHFTGWTSLIVKILQMPGEVKQGGDLRDEL
jgi:mannosyl-oligosaccharide glucosidase